MAEWCKLALRGEIEADEPHIARAGGSVVALYDVGGKVFATSGICTHEEKCLEGGYVEDGLVECPHHSATFEIATGRAAGGVAREDLKTYPVRLDGDAVFVDLSGD